ncbi:MAG: hypothetical protein HYS14_04085 [Candidatus Rokubacteria bacterium]|nr:hypothetical protein [Candidatus Rokubacteria bacterium]
MASMLPVFAVFLLAVAFQKVRAWEIKNTIDPALQPRRTHSEAFTIPLPEGTTAAEIEAVLTYHHRPGEEFVVHRVLRKVSFRK